MTGPVDFEAAFDDAPVAVLVLTAAEHRIVLGNPASGRLLGLDARALAGRLLSDFRERRGTSSDLRDDDGPLGALVGSSSVDARPARRSGWRRTPLYWGATKVGCCSCT